jgi:lysophospholipase L1-like esterase
MTAGEIVSEGIVAMVVNPVLAYPTDLQRLLTIRYASQQTFVGNAGQPGETTAQGLIRLGGLIPGQYQALLLLDGANDLSGGDPFAVQPAATNVQRMVRAGKAAGLRVFLGTMPPQNPSACRGVNAFPGCVSRSSGAELVVGYNDALKLVAAQESVPSVDVYQAFAGDVTTLIDFDGLHPTAAGYQRIADTFFSVIRQNLEIPVAAISSTGNPFPTVPFLVPNRRR